MPLPILSLSLPSILLCHRFLLFQTRVHFPSCAGRPGFLPPASEAVCSPKAFTVLRAACTCLSLMQLPPQHTGAIHLLCGDKQGSQLGAQERFPDLGQSLGFGDFQVALHSSFTSAVEQVLKLRAAAVTTFRAAWIHCERTQRGEANMLQHSSCRQRSTQVPSKLMLRHHSHGKHGVHRDR